MGDEARWLPMQWNGGKEEWACVNCNDEPWGMGMWDWFKEDRPMPDPAHDDGYGSTYTDAALKWLKQKADSN